MITRNCYSIVIHMIINVITNLCIYYKLIIFKRTIFYLIFLDMNRARLYFVFICTLLDLNSLALHYISLFLWYCFNIYTTILEIYPPSRQQMTLWLLNMLPCKFEPKTLCPSIFYLIYFNIRSKYKFYIFYIFFYSFYCSQRITF